MVHFKHRKKLYCGRVIDGPFEGDWIEEDAPYFLGQVVEPTRSYSYSLPSNGAEVKQYIYKWTSSYRAWVWVQSGRFV